MLTVMLFDLDGVLVAPRGYRAAVTAALSHYFRQWNWPLRLPAALPAQSEALGITSEWDMVPLALGAALETWSAVHGRVPDPDVLDPNGPSPGPWGTLPQPDLLAPFTQLHPHLRPGETPADTAWRLQGTPQALFPHLGRSPLAARLLTHTREVSRSPTTRLFQTLTLGTQGFIQAYGEPPGLEAASLLRKHDRALLSPSTLSRLREALARGTLHAAIYTARPSLPPRGSPPQTGYAPEAELALQVVGWPEAPLIGFGRLHWLALRRGLAHGEAFVKPAPLHPLAALLAAWWQDEIAALEHAATWLLEGRPPQPLPQALRLIVLEDSPTGLQAAHAIADFLRRHRIAVTLHLWGITTHPAKRRSLERLGAQVFPDINAALEQNAAWLA